MATISRANLYHVPGKIWHEWTPAARGVFNLVYSTMRPNQSLFIHPKAQPHSREQWHTVAWNAAWCAARAVMGDTMIGETVLDQQTGEVTRESVVRAHDAVDAMATLNRSFDAPPVGVPASRTRWQR